MRYRDLIEKYTSDNHDLLRYLNGGFDPYSVWYYCAEWIVNNDKLEELEENSGMELDAATLGDEEPELFYKLSPNDQQECGEWVYEYLLRHDPMEAPTGAHLSLSRTQLINRETWLVHFSDNARGIQNTGFTYGIDRMDQLGLTTYFKDEAKKHGGYNFAFVAGSLSAFRAVNEGKYGKHAVMFQNSGVHTYHYGDEEDQVIFWGRDVDARDIVLLYQDYGTWGVVPTRPLRSDREYLYQNDEFEKVVKWVMKNYTQYQKYLTRR